MNLANDYVKDKDLSKEDVVKIKQINQTLISDFIKESEIPGISLKKD